MSYQDRIDALNAIIDDFLGNENQDDSEEIDDEYDEIGDDEIGDDEIEDDEEE